MLMLRIVTKCEEMLRNVKKCKEILLLQMSRNNNMKTSRASNNMKAGRVF
jgi:hypothetical protein